MEFLFYLSQEARQVLALVQKAEFRISENAGFCRDQNLFGYVDVGRNFVVCTQNIKGSGYAVSHYASQTVLHEAVHVAQQCRGKAFWISRESMPLPWNKLNDVANSVNASDATSQLEHEAHWMEDKPNEIRYVLRKYCF